MEHGHDYLCVHLMVTKVDLNHEFALDVLQSLQEHARAHVHYICVCIPNHIRLLSKTHQNIARKEEDEHHGQEGQANDNSSPLQVQTAQLVVATAARLADQRLQPTVEAHLGRHTYHIYDHRAHPNCGQLDRIVQVADENQVYGLQAEVEEGADARGHGVAQNVFYNFK